MIRDEFTSQQKKQVTSREMIKIREMGARAFYSSKLMKLTDLKKAMKFSAWFSLIISIFIIGMAVLIIWAELTAEDSSLTYRGFLYGGIGLIMFLFGFLWLVLFSGLTTKKIERYKVSLKEINEKDLEKKRAAYAAYLNENK